MDKKSKSRLGEIPVGKDLSCCKVESLLSVDERGQMVFPKEIRDKARIRPGDKEGRVCCFSLIKVEELTEVVKRTLGPVMQEIFQK